MADRKVTKRAVAKSAFRTSLAPGIDLREAIIDGKITGARMRSLRLHLDVTIAELAELLGTSDRTVMRKEQSGESLSLAEADRVYRLAHVADLAVELIGDAERAKSWLKSPHRYLGDATPLTMLATEIGTDLVVESLYSIAYGGVA